MAAQFGCIALGKADSGRNADQQSFQYSLRIRIFSSGIGGAHCHRRHDNLARERAQIYFNEVIEARDTRAAVVNCAMRCRRRRQASAAFFLPATQIYLAPYDTAKTHAQRQLKVLERIAPFLCPIQLLVRRLTRIITEKFGEMDRTIALKRDQRDAEAMAMFRTNRGKALMR